jgi:alkylated DNA repair dioxygenase AlkB
MTYRLDLNDSVLPGFAARDDIITSAEEADLIARIDAADLRPFRVQQWTGKRLTRSFGWSYDFETGRFAPTDPIPDWLRTLKEQASEFAGLAPDDLAQALLIRYDPGAGIGWHKDRPVFGHVVGISLGNMAVLRLRRRAGAGFDRAKVELEPRSIYHLSGVARRDWEHSIAAIERLRWSITFRSLVRGGSAPLP